MGRRDRHCSLWPTTTEPKPSEPQDVQSNPALAWSRDGRQLLAATGAGIRVWEVQTGQVVIDHGAGWNDGDTLCGVGWGVTGPQLLTQELYGRAQLWEVTTGEPAHELEGSVRWLRCAAWSPDGRVIIAGDDHVTWIWDTQTGCALQLLEGHAALVQSVAWLNGGQQALTVDESGAERHWLVATELLEAELVRRVDEVHVEAEHWDDDAANQRVRRAVRGWRGWRAEQAALAAALQQYDIMCAVVASTRT